MCGRFILTTPPRELQALFDYPEHPDFPPRYNIAPAQPIAVVRLMNGRRAFTLMRWGLLPGWVKDPKQISLLFNARGESVLEKPAFKAAMRRRRCLIPADGFYEWRRLGERVKQPYLIRKFDRTPFALAGLWETWSGPNGEELDTAAIVTTTANRTLAPLHERMPAVVPHGAYDLWLDGSADPDDAAALIRPAPDNLFEAVPVSDAVNQATNDNPALMEQVDSAPQPPPQSRRPAPDDGQASLF